MAGDQFSDFLRYKFTDRNFTLSHVICKVSFYGGYTQTPFLCNLLNRFSFPEQTVTYLLRIFLYFFFSFLIRDGYLRSLNILFRAI